jgi:hypothetical protein
MRARTYTDEEFIAAVKASVSIRQALTLLKLKPAGGNYQAFNNTVKRLSVDTSHFTGMLWSKGKKVTLKRPIEDYLNNLQPIQSFKLKSRLLRENIFTSECSCCFLSKWLDKPIPLELDHINGNPNDNSLSNLRLLCPNCHALTTTYRGKNKKNNSATPRT